MDQAINGLPAISMMFLQGMLFDPPRAGMSARTSRVRSPPGERAGSKIPFQLARAHDNSPVASVGCYQRLQADTAKLLPHGHLAVIDDLDSIA
jgi:hypothetical protein